MATLASVKVAREKLLELLREAKDEKLAKFDDGVRKYDEKLAELREAVVKAAAADLSKEENLDALYTAHSMYADKNRNRRFRSGTDADREDLEQRYDSAIKLVEISSDDEFKVNSNTEFGYLLGL